MRLDHDRRVFVGIVIIPHRLESSIPLPDEVSYHFWAETKECKLLDNLINQFLELWRLESQNKTDRDIGLAWR